MNQKSAKGIRGSILFDSRPDGKPVLRVYGEPDPATGTKPFTDYLLCVSDLSVEVTSDYFVLLEPEPGESGEPRIDYRKIATTDPEIIPVSARDMEAIKQAIANPGEPNEALMRAAERSDRLIGRESKLRPELRKAAEESWRRNEAAFRYLEPRDGPAPTDGDAAKPDLDAMFGASWEQNEAGYRHLAGQLSSGEDGAAETFEFCVRLAGNPDLTPDLLNALFEAGCGDATPLRIDGVTYLDFARVGSDLGSAIQSALRDVRKAGCDPIFPKPKREAGEQP